MKKKKWREIELAKMVSFILGQCIERHTMFIHDCATKVEIFVLSNRKVQSKGRQNSSET